MKAMYSFKGKATQAEISARAKLEELSTEMLDYLVEKGILERDEYNEEGRLTSRYKLTVTGSGYLFHLAPSL
jgi:DNA-binding HxlR family transcriptional regulator